jgi:hypothetical protein
MNTVSGATEYELYEAAGTSSAPSDSAYNLIQSGSSLSKSNIKHSGYGYQYYRYKACNGTGSTRQCGGLSGWRRVYIYTTASRPSYINLTTTNVNTGQSYKVNFGASNGAVDGTEYQLYELLPNGSEFKIYTITREHWSDPTDYSSNYIIKYTPGSYRYRVRACNPSVSCSSYRYVYQTVIAPNSAPVANNDSISLNQGSSKNFSVLANDTDSNGDNLTVTSASSSQGSVTVQSNQTLTFSPNSNFYGRTGTWANTWSACS